MDDNEIVERFLRRDEVALKEVAEKYGARLRALAFSIVEDARTAEECENDAYMRAWDAIPPHEPRDWLFAFLARLVRHSALDRCRAENRLCRRADLCQLTAEMEECIPGPDDLEDRMDGMALQECLNRFLAELKPKQRIVFLRRYWFEDTVEEIAKRCGMTRSGVKTTLFRLRGKLKTWLIREGYDL